MHAALEMPDIRQYLTACHELFKFLLALQGASTYARWCCPMTAGPGGGLVLNAEFLRFAAHWGFLPRSCRPYRAQTKGKVERPIRYIRENFFYGRSFANDDDLNEQAAGTSNVRRHATTGERPIDRFERDERAVLLPLANHPYRHLGVRQAPDLAPRLLPATVEVERRPLSVYAEALQ